MSITTSPQKMQELANQIIPHLNGLSTSEGERVLNFCIDKLQNNSVINTEPDPS